MGRGDLPSKQLAEPSIIPQNASDLSMMLFPKHTTTKTNNRNCRSYD